jgi:hypothetical protein
MDGDLEGFGHVRLHVDLDDLPSFSFSLNKGALLGNGFVTVHVKVYLFSGRIGVVSKNYLFGGSHALHRWRRKDKSRSLFSFLAPRTGIPSPERKRTAKT